MPTKSWMEERKQVTFWMEPADYDAFSKLCHEKGLAIAEAFRRLAIDLLAHEQDGQEARDAAP